MSLASIKAQLPTLEKAFDAIVDGFFSLDQYDAVSKVIAIDIPLLLKVAEAMMEDVLECGGWCDPNDGCLVCYQYETCRKRLALAELESSES